MEPTVAASSGETRMIRSTLCFAATAVIRDADSNSVSVFNLFEGFLALQLPVLVPQLSCFSLWVRDDGDPQRIDGNFTVTLDDEVLTMAAMHVDFAGPLTKRTRTVIHLGGLVIPRIGLLRIRFVLTSGATAEYVGQIEAPPAVVTQS